MAAAAAAAPNLNLDLADTSSITSEEEEEDPLRPIHRLLSFSTSKSILVLDPLSLKGHGNEPDFPRFLHKSVRHRSHKLHFEPFRFWLRILGDIRIRKSTPRLNDTGSRRLSVSMIRGVGDSPTQRYGESTTLRITDTRSMRLPASPIRRVGY
jgi:hypothetical protein